jgi:hypothetical protein
MDVATLGLQIEGRELALQDGGQIIGRRAA